MGKRGEKMEGKAKLMSLGNIRDEFRIILNDHAFMLLTVVYLSILVFIKSK